MPVDISVQVDRIQKILQDEAELVWTREKIVEQHARELNQLSKLGMFGRIQWIQASAGTSQYTLEEPAVSVFMVLYNEKVLHPASEEALDRRYRGWEGRAREPEYWSVDAQSPRVIRIIPAPLRTGSAVPVFPAVPLAQNAVDNLVVFFSEDVAEEAGQETDPFPVLDVLEDVAVFQTVQALSEQERESQDLPLAGIHGDLAKLWLRRLGM